MGKYTNTLHILAASQRALSAALDNAPLDYERTGPVGLIEKLWHFNKRVSGRSQRLLIKTVLPSKMTAPGRGQNGAFLMAASVSSV